MAGAKHGSKAVFMLHDGTALRDISAYVSEDSLDRSADTAETTTFGKTSKTYIPGLKDGTISLSGNYDTVATSALLTLELGLGVERAFEFYPGGNVSGERKYSGNAIVTSLNASSSVDDKSAVSGELQITGDVTAAAVA